MMKKFLSSSLLGFGLFLYTNICYAESVLLDRTELVFQAKPAVAELWGELNEYNYAQKLNILIKQNNHVVAAYQPELDGGYGCYLDTVNLKKSAPEEKQLLYCIGQGDWQDKSIYGILDLTNPKHLNNIFTVQDNKGLLESAELKKTKLVVTVKGRKPSVAAVPKDFSDTQPARILNYEGYHTVLPYDVDGDGVQELFVCQRLQKNRQQLADVGAILSLKEEGWKASAYTIMTAASSKQQEGVNNGISFSEGVILPRRLVLPRGEYTMPILLLKEKAELHNSINSLIFSVCLPHIKGFMDYTEDFAFKVKRADKQVLSFQFMFGKNNIDYSCLTIDMQTGKKLELDDILDVKNKDLLPLLQLLRSNKESDFTKELPQHWYLEKKDIYMLQQINGKTVGSVFDLDVLRKYVVKKELLKN